MRVFHLFLYQTNPSRDAWAIRRDKMNLFEKIAQEAMIDELEKIAILSAREVGLQKANKTYFESIKPPTKTEVAKAQADEAMKATKGFLKREGSNAKEGFRRLGGAFGSDLHPGAPLKENILSRLSIAEDGARKLIRNPLVLGGAGALAVGGTSAALLRKKQTTAQKLLALAAKNKIGLGIGAGAAGLAGLGALALND
jgi:hypothetical protein